MSNLGARIKAIELQLSLKPVRLILRGGLPKDWRPPAERPVPGGSDLAAEHAIAMAKAAQTR